MREVAVGHEKSGRNHVTIRGPYTEPIRPSQVSRYQRLLSSAPLLLEGVDTFQAVGRHFVYLKVHHPRLRQIWWKPDYPVAKYGFNPHITLYEGPDQLRAKAFVDFLKREQIKLLTWNFVVTTHVSDQRDLFARRTQDAELFLGLVRSGHVKPDVISRLGNWLSAASRAA